MVGVAVEGEELLLALRVLPRLRLAALLGEGGEEGRRQHAENLVGHGAREEEDARRVRTREGRGGRQWGEMGWLADGWRGGRGEGGGGGYG